MTESSNYPGGRCFTEVEIKRFAANEYRKGEKRIATLHEQTCEQCLNAVDQAVARLVDEAEELDDSDSL